MAEVGGLPFQIKSFLNYQKWNLALEPLFTVLVKSNVWVPSPHTNQFSSSVDIN